MTITLKAVKSVEGCDHFIELQCRVWGSDPLDVVPNHVTVTVLKNGGALLGAYADDGPAEMGGMIGAAFWWLGVDERQSGPARLKICSHMAAVLPEWQGKGVGRLLKLKQREMVLQQGLTDWVTWTYDPLQRVNAVLNLHRLGGTCNTYLRNVYGVMHDALNAGTPSDRFQVDWHLRSERVIEAVEGRGARGEKQAHATRNTQHSTAVETGVQVLPSVVNRQGLQQPMDVDLKLDGEPVAVPIPDDINVIRGVDAELGLAWRLYTRTMLEAAFGAGYMAVDCIHLPGRGWHYLLERQGNTP
jgi:predicted GNAT superfamily acetyltransferase